MKGIRSPESGFTLIEMLLVLVVVGVMAAIVFPRFMRAQADSNFSQVRQYGSEIASYIITWAQDQAQAQRPETTFTLKDFLAEDILEEDGAGVTSRKLVDKYTGNEDYDGVEALIPPERMPLNPFNQVSYFAPVNDDTEVPSKKTGLLYLAAKPDPKHSDYLNFYLLYTSEARDEAGEWHGGMDHRDADKIRRGIFVTRLYDDQEYGGGERYLLGPPREEVERPGE